MGGNSSSTRRVTLTEDDATGAVQISEAVARRLLGRPELPEHRPVSPAETPIPNNLITKEELNEQIEKVEKYYQRQLKAVEEKALNQAEISQENINARLKAEQTRAYEIIEENRKHIIAEYEARLHALQSEIDRNKKDTQNLATSNDQATADFSERLQQELSKAAKDKEEAILRVASEYKNLLETGQSKAQKEKEEHVHMIENYYKEKISDLENKAQLDSSAYKKQVAEEYKALVDSLQADTARLTEDRKQRDEFYKQKLTGLESQNKELFESSKVKFSEAVAQTEKRFHRPSRSPVCVEAQRQVMECYKNNVGKTLNCSSIVAAYIQCVDQHRHAVITSNEAR